MTVTLPTVTALAAAVQVAEQRHADAEARLVNLRLLWLAVDTLTDHPGARYVTVYESDESRCAYPSDVFDATGARLAEPDLTDDFAHEDQEACWGWALAQGHPIPDLEDDVPVLDLLEIVANVHL